jgi:signal transduction histidine kinase
MFRSLKFKIVLSAVVLALLQTTAVMWWLAQSSVQQSQSDVLDLLAREAELDSLRVRSDLGGSAARLSEISLQRSLVFILEDRSMIGQLPPGLSEAAVLKLLPSEQSRVFISRCQNEEWLCSYSWITEANAWAFRAVPTSTFSAIRQQLLTEALFVLLICLIVSVALSYFMMSWVLRPLSLFVKAAQDIASGRYQVNLPLDRSDEVGQLAQSLHAMAQEIEKREHSIESAGRKLSHAARLASIGQMGASVAHEIKNPLTSMRGYAQVIKDKVQSEDLKEAAQIIVEETDRCNQIVSQMLRFARHESREFKPYALKDVVDSTLALCQTEAKKSRIALLSDLKVQTPLLGNPQQTQQILLNILLNAIHASHHALPTKPEAAAIHINATETNTHAIIRIKDFAGGIPMNARERIFDPFFTTKSKSEGTGLGLAVALDLSVQQNGQLTFESQEGEGTEFTLILPLAGI